MTDSPRVLLIAHGHPSYSRGGAELVAKTMFDEYRRRGLDVTLLARVGVPGHAGCGFSALGSDRELLFHTGMRDLFCFTSAEPIHVWKDFRDLLGRLRPSVVHFHHYVHVGLEAIHEVRRTVPDARIVLTLHEYLLLCHHQGQMVKANTHELCYRSSPEECARCYPHYSAGDFFLRERYIKTVLEEVDLFIAPSRFLADRYVDWGLPAERVQVVENGQIDVAALPPRELRSNEARGRFAYFGQINPYKGTLLLLDAFRRLAPEHRRSIHLDIHGQVTPGSNQEFQDAFAKLLEDTRDVADYHGPYEPRELRKLMERIDWVIVPSTWWENSPLVIQEALALGRPVICSNIGGMAEKVRDGLDGYHFPVGNASALSELVTRLSSSLDAWNRVVGTLQRPPQIRETAERHLTLYAEC